MNWTVPKIWEGGEVWILGGGPSITKQFEIPDEIVRRVLAGESPSLYSPYMEAIHEKHVIAVNVAYLIGTWIDMVFFGDSGSFYLPHQARLAVWPNLKVSCHSVCESVSWVKYLAKDRRGKGISDNPKTVCWNVNSGAASISVAANAGAKRIILVGFDMRLGDYGERHWHNEYRSNPTSILPKGAIKSTPYHRHLAGFEQIALDAKRRGIEIINASPTSTIKEFPKVAVKELI